MGKEAQSYCVQLAMCLHFAPCLHEETDTRIFARATEGAQRPNKKISSSSVDTIVVVLVIPAVQQL